MTKLAGQSPLPRETAATVFETGKDRPIIVVLHPKYLVLRAKGLPNSAVSLDYETLYRRTVWENAKLG